MWTAYFFSWSDDRLTQLKWHLAPHPLINHCSNVIHIRGIFKDHPLAKAFLNLPRFDQSTIHEPPGSLELFSGYNRRNVVTQRWFDTQHFLGHRKMCTDRFVITRIESESCAHREIRFHWFQTKLRKCGKMQNKRHIGCDNHLFLNVLRKNDSIYYVRKARDIFKPKHFEF